MNNRPEIITPTHVFFYSGGTIYSNFYWTHNQFQFGLANPYFHCSEAAFMYCKACFFNDLETAEKIKLVKSAFEAKTLGREVKGYVDSDWATVRLAYMENVLEAKFGQNPAWKVQLLETGDRILVEASPTDKIWGIGRSVEEAAAGAKWMGTNLLGIALMRTREGLKKRLTAAKNLVLFSILPNL